MKKYDPRRIMCPYCKARAGAWCMVGRVGKVVDGFIHSRRYKHAGGSRRRARVAPNQLPLFR